MEAGDGAELDLVAHAYGVLCGEAEWGEVMGALNARFSLTYSMIATRTRGPTLLNAGVHSARPAAIAEVLDYWGRHDTRTPRYIARAATRQGRLISDADLFEAAELAKSPLHHDYFRPRGADDFVGLALPMGGEEYFFLAGLPIGCTPPEGARADRLAATMVHLVRAAELWAARNRTRLLAEIAARGPGRAAVAVDSRGRWAWLGPEGRTALAGHLRIENAAPCFAERALWTPLLRALEANHHAGDRDDPAALALERPHAPPLVLTAERIRIDPFDPLATGDLAAILKLHDTHAPPQGPGTGAGAALRALGLTPAEVRLAQRVGRALTPAQAADELGISVTTARSTLASIYSKLAITRQAELVRLVTLLIH